ncbi:putative MFS family arabinose efflux permease [Actinomadura pelletieri DSM 43383]|uniref:Putative MFS family arabinose efflux permease n=1 Tax=Actinomadura pelletieri DSM 43383 TaxID=1120940 RepID=A0A495QN17_9ACTN|nr:MFS transporter [Actinomadura pelletieri]RKS74326.1 putative MFS family arabinose efflux permease [Actinomadura pelletieri DSM 43383]
MSDDMRLGTVTTRIPARMDRLPWSRFHWMVVIGLGTVWILDGLEVTIVGSVAARLTEDGSGIALSPADIGYAAAIYVAGACTGALLFGQLTDRFGRKKLFILTLAVYVVATVATAFAFAPWYFFICRFVTGMGIGGEYAAINSAIDELIPARARGRVDIIINGSYWVGAALGALAAVLLLNEGIFPADFGWRLAFGAGGLLGLVIMFVRRHVPESPRWLFIHGRDEEAERIVDGIERDIREETRQELEEPGESITVRQRKTISFKEIGGVAFKHYTTRAVLGLALFVGQAFLYNAVTFDLGTILSEYFAVASATVPYFFAMFALGNFLGPLLLGRLFDTVGRKPMIAGTYLAASAFTVLLGVLLMGDGLTRWTFMALIGVTFFFASAGASSAYLTVSEIFPMETRALAIAFFYAIGTAVGGITGPLLFGRLIDSGNVDLVAIGFFVGAAIMTLGGIAEIFYGVRAEKASLENIAKPLTAAEAEEEEPAVPGRRDALEARRHAEERRALAAEHRAAVHELRPRADEGDRDAAERLRVEEVLAQTAEWDAERLLEEATAHDERAAAERAATDDERRSALESAAAADERARALRERTAALTAADQQDAETHAALASAAAERARAREQNVMAAQARARAAQAEGAEAEVARRQAETFDEWEKMHAELALAYAARADRDEDEADRHDREAAAHRLRAEAAADRMEAAQHRSAAASLAEEAGAAARTRPADRERDERIRERVLRRERMRPTGWRRVLPGPGETFYSPGMLGTASRWSSDVDIALDREVNAIARALEEHGPTTRRRLAELVGARFWGPGRFRSALREAVHEGVAQPQARNRYAPPSRPTDTEQ